MKPHRPVGVSEAETARVALRGIATRTPLVRLELEEAPAEIYLKLETLQPVGSFKIRGAATAFAGVNGALDGGVWTASAGNMAHAVAYLARAKGIPASVVVPDTAPEAKLAALERLGAKVLKVPFDTWLRIFETRGHEAMTGYFIHPFSDRSVMTGNATIGLEILEDLPEVDAVIIPYGGGGLTAGIASVVRALAPRARIYACEVDTAAPLAASLAAGKPVEVEYRSSFVDGIGAPRVFPEMFELVRKLVDGSIVVPVADVAAAVRLLAVRAKAIAEGAGAAAVAAALTGRAGAGKVVCIVSGGNIDASKLAAILEGTRREQG